MLLRAPLGLLTSSSSSTLLYLQHSPALLHTSPMTQLSTQDAHCSCCRLEKGKNCERLWRNMIREGYMGWVRGKRSKLERADGALQVRGMVL